jgi:hypothetical protein
VHELRIKSVLPSRGLLGGGLSVTIEGGGFYQGFAEGATDAKKQTRVKFGANEVAELDIIDDDTMEVISPPNRRDPPRGHLQPQRRRHRPGCFTYYVDLVSPRSRRPAARRGRPGGGAEGRRVDRGPDGAHRREGLPEGDGGRCADGAGHRPSRRRRRSVDVRAFNKNGIGEIRRGFTYFEPLRLDRAEPPAGPIAGGGSVRLFGKSLGGATRVLFGDAEAAFTVVDDGTLEAVAPAAAAGAGAVDLAVETTSGAATRAGGYVYFDPRRPTWRSRRLADARAGGRRQHADDRRRGLRRDHDLRDRRRGRAAGDRARAERGRRHRARRRGESLGGVGVAGLAAQVTLGGGYHYNVALDSVAPASGRSAGGDSVALAGAASPTAWRSSSARSPPPASR